MPKLDDVPHELKPYAFHGVEFEAFGPHATQVLADCPWCGREGKFSIRIDNGLWRCFICAAGGEKGGGNSLMFLRLLWEEGQRRTGSAEYDQLAADRGLLHPKTLVAWGVCKSPLTGEWLVPGFSIDGRLSQLYRYARVGTGKPRLLATPNHNHQLFGIPLYDPKRPHVYLTEGPWDAMCLWEALGMGKVGEDGALVTTGSPSVSLRAHASVLAVPGCGTFSEGWARLLEGKRLSILFDNDHPREVQGRQVRGAALEGMVRLCGVLSRAAEQPSEIDYLAWGEEGYNLDLPSGTDVRDILTDGTDPAGRVATLGRLLDLLEPIPADWTPGGSGKAGKVEIDPLPCDNWQDLRLAWRKAMKWTPGLEHALCSMLACVVSTEAAGDQLWMRVMGPAGCGKSTLCEALSTSKKYIRALSTLRGFHSGYQTDRDGTEDNSLLAQVKNKTLVIKDGDTLLQSPNLQQILSEARDVYDRVSRTHYRNKTAREYEGLNMTFILCGTSSLRTLDSSELGERFLSCLIMEHIDGDLEDEALLRVANKAQRSARKVSDGTFASQHLPDELLAKRLTGGYVEHLRTHAERLLGGVEMADRHTALCIALGKFVSYVRARPSTRQEETAEREFAARLVSQHVRYAMCLTAVMGKAEVDDEVMERTRRIALDTARGRTLDLIRFLYRCGPAGADSKSLSAWIGETPMKTLDFLRFLKRIGAVEGSAAQAAAIRSSKIMWALTPTMRILYWKATGEGYDGPEGR